MKLTNLIYIAAILIFANCTMKSDPHVPIKSAGKESVLGTDSARKMAILLKDSAIYLINFKGSEYYDEAMTLLDSSINVDPEFDFAYYEKVDLYCRMKQYDKAISLQNESMQRFESMKPENQFYLGMLYHKRGDTLLAYEQYQMAADAYHTRFIEKGAFLDLLAVAKALYVIDKKRELKKSIQLLTQHLIHLLGFK